ncbi:MAG: hypothetical protein MJB12_05380 [Firmicutes bacterium]|nr:hypothetical protein [Bacillota bacterium]
MAEENDSETCYSKTQKWLRVENSDEINGNIFMLSTPFKILLFEKNNEC